MKAINGTTYEPKTKLGDVSQKIVVGGSGSKFVPNINMSFDFDTGTEEYFINLNRKNKVVGNESASLVNGKISQKIGTETDEYYIDDARLKWDIVFDEPPDSLTIEWELKHSAGLSFYFQPELTAEEIEDGCDRPDDVVGSYAIYCSKIGCRTGKLCHVYRPHIIDSDGKTDWCGLSINDNKLIIILPDSINTMLFPVRLDPTFGYASNGATATYMYSASTEPRGSTYNAYTATAGQVVTKFSVYASLQDAGNSDIQMAAYTVVSDDLNTRLADVVKATITSTSAAWIESVELSQTMAAATYGMAVSNYGESNDIIIYYDNGGSSNYKRGNAAGALPASWTTGTTASRLYSMYVTYREGGGGNSFGLILHSKTLKSLALGRVI